MNNVLNQIYRWFTKAVPAPTPQNQSVQVGVHLEEVAEMLEALHNAFHDPSISVAFNAVEALAGKFKSNSMGWEEHVDAINRTELLDSMADQVVTAVGVFHMMDFDLRGLNEVARSNDSKFENGKPVFNDDGKIIKGENYFPPNLTPYIFKFTGN